MKRYLILTFIIISNLSLISQNWTLINPGYKYNYRHDTAQYITNTIYIDSFEIINGDSVDIRIVSESYSNNHSISNLVDIYLSNDTTNKRRLSY